MKLLSEATPQDISSVLRLIAAGEKPSSAVLSIFNVSVQDAEAIGRMWVESHKSETLVDDDAILTKEGALKRLAVLALYSEDEETQRKATMDIAKLQKWVEDPSAVNLNILNGSMQDIENFLLAHSARLKELSGS